jgi:hypothetical protein
MAVRNECLYVPPEPVDDIENRASQKPRESVIFPEVSREHGKIALIGFSICRGLIETPEVSSKESATASLGQTVNPGVEHFPFSVFR